MQYTAAHCNTLQHTATDCNTPQHWLFSTAVLGSRPPHVLISAKHLHLWLSTWYAWVHASLVLCHTRVYCAIIGCWVIHVNLVDARPSTNWFITKWYGYDSLPLQDTATHCNTRQCKTLQDTARHCLALQHTATHCSTLQHTTRQHNTRHCKTVQDTGYDAVANDTVTKSCIDPFDNYDSAPNNTTTYFCTASPYQLTQYQMIRVTDSVPNNTGTRSCSDQIDIYDSAPN